MNRQWYILACCLLILAACSPPTAEPPAATRTKTPPPATTATPDATRLYGQTYMPGQTPLHMQTPPPSRTPLPVYTPTPSPEPTPTLYANVWLSGYLTPESTFQVGNNSFGTLILQATIEPLDASVAAALEAVPPGDSLVILEGNFYPEGERNGRLVVENVQLVNLPYTADTPLDATFTHEDPSFTLNYPTGWSIKSGQSEAEPDFTISNAPPDAVSLRPGREFLDPTLLEVAAKERNVSSVDEYVENLPEIVLETGVVEFVEINGRRMARVFTQNYGEEVAYTVQINESVVSFFSKAHSEPFLRRMLATLQE